MTIKQLAERVIKQLKAEGFTIQLYEAYTTHSVYIKLDYGMCHSIRISDHDGKKHLKYRYNVLTSYKGHHPKSVYDGFPRMYYSAKKGQTDQMMHDIINSRDVKLAALGKRGYEAEMIMKRNENEGNRSGFWASARLIHEGEVKESKQKFIKINEGVLEW